MGSMHLNCTEDLDTGYTLNPTAQHSRADETTRHREAASPGKKGLRAKLMRAASKAAKTVGAIAVAAGLLATPADVVAQPPPPAFSNPAPADMDILLLGGDDGPYLADVKTKLDDLGWFNSVTSFNVASNTPDVTTLQQYDAVLVWSSARYDDRTALGDALAQYHEAGGGVVCAMFETAANASGPHYHLGGTWETDGYRVITRGGWTFTGGPLAIDMPGHPMMEGVNSLEYGACPVTTTLEPGGILVASSDGHPLVAYKEVNNRHVVDLGFYPVSTDSAGGAAWDASTDGAILIGNALVFSAQPALLPPATNPVPADMDILLLGADHDHYLADVETKLQNLGWFNSVTGYNVRTGHANPLPDLAMLEDYDAILVWTSRPYKDPVALGNLLARYHNRGGGVVCIYPEVASTPDSPHFYHPLDGAWRNGYQAITRGLWSDVETDGFSLGDVHIDDHPLMYAVHNLVFNSRVQATTLEPGGVLVASTNDDHPLIAYKTVGHRNIVDLGFYAVSQDESTRGWKTTTDGIISIANALIYSAAPAPLPPPPPPGAPRIALLGTDLDAVNDVYNRLAYLAMFDMQRYDISVVTPSLETLEQYDAVLVWGEADDMAHPTILGNNLTLYHQAGGGVVTGMPETAGVGPFIGGSWVTPDQQLIPRGPAQAGDYTVGAVLNPDHPIMQGVSGLHYYSRPTVTTLNAGADMVAWSNDGYPLVSTRRGGADDHHIVDLGFNLASIAVDPLGWDPASDGDQLIANSLLFSMALPPAAPAPAVNAVDDWYQVAEDGTLVVSQRGVLSNDQGTDPASFFVNVVQDVQHGVLTLNSDGSFTYTPNANYSGTDMFTYVLSDGQGNTDTATVHIDVIDVGDVPVAIDDNYTVSEDGSLVRTAAQGVLVNDVDPDDPAGASLQAFIVSDPSHGTVTAFNTDGSFTYEPFENYNGPDSFTYYITNGSASSALATVHITVVAVADAPVASPNSYAASQNTPLHIAAPGVMVDDYHPDGLTFWAVIVGPGTTAEGGSVSLSPDGSFVYTPAPGFTGTDSFEYTLMDTAGASSAAVTVTLLVGSVNQAPVALADNYELYQSTVDYAGNVLDNDFDPDAGPQALTAIPVSGVSNGTLVFNTDGSFTYTPSPTFSGTDSFTYKAFDGELESAPVTVTFTVVAELHPPQAADDLYNTAEDTPLTISAPGVLGNDWDLDSDPADLSASLVSAPLYGTVSLQPDGSFVYTPRANYNSDVYGFPDEFEYQVTDEQGLSSTAVVEIWVTSVIDAPVARDDSYTLLEDTVDFGLDLGSVGGIEDLLAAGFMSVLANDTFEFLDIFALGIAAPLAAPAGEAALDANGQGDPFSGLILGTGQSVVILQDTVDHGTLDLNPLTGTFLYTPNANFSGTDSFTYAIATLGISFNGQGPIPLDQAMISNTATVTFNVIGVNDAPVAHPNSYTTTENMALTVHAPGILSNDIDPDGDALSALLQSNVSNGTLDLRSDGSFTYTPAPGFHGTDSFTYLAFDGEFESNVETVTITVTEFIDDPVAVDDSYHTDEDTTLTIVAPGVLWNDEYDVDPSQVTVDFIQSPRHGTLESWADGSFIYVPGPDYNGLDSFSYRIHDGNTFSNVATVTIEVIPVDDAPVANPNTYSIQEGSLLNIPAPGILANDYDVDGDPLTALPEDGPLNGQLLMFAGDGSFQYLPNPGYNGQDLFTYRASDGRGNTSEVTTVTIHVGPVNDAPVALDDHYTVYEDEVTTIPAPGVLANDTDSDDEILTASLVTAPRNGTLVFNEDGGFVYTPRADYHGPDSFTYQANDLVSQSNVATVTIEVLPVDDAPLGNADYFAVDEDQVLHVAAPGILGNDQDADGDYLTAILHHEPPHGQILLAADGGFTYTPDPDFNGQDQFFYAVNDGTSSSELTTVTITVRPRNDRPDAIADFYVTDEDTPLVVSAPGVLVNDTDLDDDVLTASLELAPLYGTVVFNEDGSFEYTPGADFNGVDSFTYRAHDAEEKSNPAVVTITVAAVNDIPEANDDAYSTPQDVELVSPAPGVLANDFDADGDALTALIVDNPENGVVTLNADGSFIYTPNPEFEGTDSFTYRAHDGQAVSADLATVTITVGPVNDVPVARDDEFSLFEDTTAVFADPGVLQNDYDGDAGDTLEVRLVLPPLYGTLTLNPTGGFTYTPDGDFTGTDQFTYQVFDGAALSNVALVTLNVLPRADQPIANEDAYSTAQDQPLAVARPGVLGNDFDADGETLVALLKDNVRNGTLVLNGDGSFIYTPAPGFVGTDSFTYYANDGHGNSVEALVTIEVHDLNDIPVAVDDIYNAVEDEVLTVPASNGVLANDYDLDPGDTLTAVLINQPLSGMVSLSSDGGFVYTPNPDFNGEDYFIYRAYDGRALSEPARVTIRVAPVQDRPVGVADMYSVPEDKVLTVVAPGVLGNDFDVDKEPLTAILVDHPANGVIELSASGGFTYMPDPNFFGIDTFTYYANDGWENSELVTVTISVGGRNDGPVAVDDLYYTPEDVVLSIGAPGVLGNDTDDDGDVLQAVLITPALHGSLTLNSDGSFEYTPNPDFHGEDRFVYRAKDDTTMSNPATVRIVVTPVNDAPVLSNVFVTPVINENDEIILTADLYDADPHDTFLVSVDWGDGTAPTIQPFPAGTSKIWLTHRYLDDNPTGTPVDTNVVVLTVQDGNTGSDTATREVQVHNIAPQFENVSLTQVIPTGGQARLQATITDVGTLDTFVLTVDWGDGHVDTYNHGPGTSPFDYIHTYAVPGTYTVTATVRDDDGGETTIVPSLLVRNTAELALHKTANPDPSSVGEHLTYTMTVTNHGPDTAHNVILMDTLPANIEILSSEPAHIPADGVLNWFLGDMPAGQTYRIDLVVKTLQQGPITNVATVISNELDPNMENNTAAVTTTVGWLPDGPDLMAEAITVDTVCKLKKNGVQCKVKLWALVANRGNQDAGKSVYSVYLSDDNIFSPDSDTKLKTKKFKKLKAGRVQGQKQTIKLPRGWTTTGKFIIVVLDEGNLVFEGNETNNLIIYGPLP